LNWPKIWLSVKVVAEADPVARTVTAASSPRRRRVMLLMFIIV
jgi:hypothetical protein